MFCKLFQTKFKSLTHQYIYLEIKNPAHNVLDFKFKTTKV